jgi:hypothetical protein
MNPYDQLLHQATKKTSQLIRNIPDVSHRVKILNRCKEFHNLLNEIKQDYPKATIQEIKTTIVNRLRHSDEFYKQAMKMKISKKEYTALFLYTMDLISIYYPWISDEVIRQINKKTQHHDIIEIEQSRIFSFNIQKFIKATVFTKKHSQECFAR